MSAERMDPRDVSQIEADYAEQEFEFALRCAMFGYCFHEQGYSKEEMTTALRVQFEKANKSRLTGEGAKNA